MRILDLFAEDSWRNVYGGELEVRPPGALTTPRAGGSTSLNPRDGAGERRRTPSEFSPYSKQLLCVTKAFVIKSRLCSRVSASIRRLDEHGPMHRHVRTGGAERMNAGLVCGQQAQRRLRGEAR
jgi:hypothetical protein